jgi:hypothetical protein
MTDDPYAENEASRLKAITAVADLVQAVAEKSATYGLNEEELAAINNLQKQVAEQARTRLEEIFDTLEEARQRNQRRRIVKAVKRVARVQWRRAGGGGWQRVELQRQIANKQYIRNEERLSFRQFVEARNPFDEFLRNYRRGPEKGPLRA